MSKVKAGAVALIATLALAPAVEAQKTPKRVPGKEIAATLKTSLPKAMGKVTRATCPKSIRNKKGQTARCTVTFAAGDKVGFRIRLTDRNGGFKPTLLDMMMRKLEADIEAAVKTFKARAVCPEKRKVKKNDTFTCDVYNGTTLAGYLDMKQSGDGRVSYTERSAQPGSTPANPVPAED